MSFDFTLEHMGDRGLLVRFDAKPSSELTAVLAGLAHAAAELPGVVDACPGLTTVLIESRPERTEEIQARVPRLVDSVEPAAGNLHEVRVTYDGEDLDRVCQMTGLDAQKLVSLHSGQVYDVRLLGSPGFIYLSDVPARLEVPRLDEPRTSVPAGSVGIAGRQAGIYGRARPGGWRIIGHAAELPRVLPGDRVRFVPG